MSQKQIAEFHAAILQNLPALSLAEMQGWIGPRRTELNVLLRQMFRSASALPFLKNEHGHYVIEVTGRALTGVEEIELLAQCGFDIEPHARHCFLSTNSDSYDANHQLEEGRVYRLAIVPGRDVKKSRTVSNIRSCIKQFGYSKPLAGAIPRLREMVTDKQLAEMGFEYIVALHDPIEDLDGFPGLLSMDRNRGLTRWLDARWSDYGSERGINGAFAFLVPEA